MGCKSSKDQHIDRKELTEDEIEVILQNTEYTRADIKAFYENSFVKLYPNGYMHREQFKKLYRELYPYKADINTDEFLNLLFRAFDTDGSGFISFTEFLIAVSLSGRKEPNEKLAMAFRLYDHNKNGRLEEKEIENIVAGLNSIANGVPTLEKEHLYQWDKDKSGYLTEQEFIEFVLSNKELTRYFINLIKTHDC